MGYPGRQNIYQATIRRMVRQALEAQEQQFREVHADDTDAQLLAYLADCAARLGYSPWPGEIVGGSMIEERFGAWSRAIRLARLPMPQNAKSRKPFARVQEETERQKEVYRRRKAEKKQLAEKRRAQQAAKKKSAV